MQLYAQFGATVHYFSAQEEGESEPVAKAEISIPEDVSNVSDFLRGVSHGYSLCEQRTLFFHWLVSLSHGTPDSTCRTRLDDENRFGGLCLSWRGVCRFDGYVSCRGRYRRLTNVAEWLRRNDY